MLAGLKARFHRLRLSLSAGASKTYTGGVGSGSHSYDCTLASQYLTGPVPMLLAGISLSIQGRDTSTLLDTIYSVSIPSLLLTYTHNSGAFDTAPALRIELVGVDLLETSGGVWQLHIASIEVYRGGTLVTTWTGPYSLTAAGLTPAHIPLLGLPFKAQATAQAGSYGWSAYAPHDVRANTDCSMSAGLAFKQVAAGSWEALPMNAYGPILPVEWGECSPSLTLTGVVSASDSDSVSISAKTETRHLYVEYSGEFYERTDIETETGWLYIVADLPKGVIKKGDDYAALIRRGGFPSTYYTGTRSCGPSSDPPSDPPPPLPWVKVETTRAEVHPSTTERYAVVEEAEHSIEDAIGDPIYYPWSAGRSDGTGMWVGTGVTIPPTNSDPPPDPIADFASHGVTFSFPSEVQHRQKFTDPPPNWGMLELLEWDDGHLSPTEEQNVFTYWNYRAHPHWSYRYHADDWSVDGVPVAWELYWALLGDQWLSHPNLVEEEDTEQRTTLVTAELTDGPNASFLSGALPENRETSWWGIDRYHVDRIDPATAATLDTLALWTASAGTLSISGGLMTVSGHGGSPFTLTCKLHDWTYGERCFGHAFNSILVGSRSSGWSQAIYSVIGRDASTSKVTFGTLTTLALDILPWPPDGLVSTRYAGTWRFAWGLLVVSDQGADDAVPPGDSANRLTDAETAPSFQFLPGRSGRTLEVAITPTGTANVTLDAPQIARTGYSDSDLQVCQMGRQESMILWADGPSLRWGSWSFWDYVADAWRYPPIQVGPGAKRTAVDYFAWRSLLFDEADPNAAMLTNLATVFDNPREFTTVQHCAHHSFASILEIEGPSSSVDIGGIIHNGYDPPPIACLPALRRDPDTLDDIDGERGLEVLDIAERRQLCVTPKRSHALAHLYDPAGVDWLQQDPDAVAGWDVRFHVKPVQNDAAEDDFELHKYGSRWAKEIRPWHSLHGVLYHEDIDSRGVHSIGMHNQGLTATVWHGETDITSWVFGREVDHQADVALSRTDVTSAQIAYSSSDLLAIAFADDGDLYWTESEDNGHTWSTPVALGISGTQVAICTEPDGEVEYLAVFDTSAYKLYRLISGEVSHSLISTIVSGVTEGRGGLSWQDDEAGTLTFVIDSGGTPRRFISTDRGATWTET